MKIKLTKNLILLITMVMLCFSCTKEERREVIKSEVDRSTSFENDIVNDNNTETNYKYIINTRTGKVHTYSDGISRVSEKYQHKTNDSIEKILENENYDVCLNCYAGLKLNLQEYKSKNDKYKTDDEDDLSNAKINLIQNYMRLYEFGQIDSETQKFLMSIFEVGNWYVNNVYTQLGGKLSAREVDDIAETMASESAYNKWRNYLDNEYNFKYEFRENKKILPVVYDKGEPTDMVTYRCDLFKDLEYGKGDNIYSKSGLQTLKNAEGEEIDREWKNYCVVDDSSKFATAVYYHYINKEILKDKPKEERTAYDIDLWGTSSKSFSKANEFIKKISTNKVFSLITWDAINKKIVNDKIELYYNSKSFNLKVGDLLYRKGHVEFYLGENKVVSWGRIHKDYTINKAYEAKLDGYHSNDYEDEDKPFVTILRFRGGNN